MTRSLWHHFCQNQRWNLPRMFWLHRHWIKVACGPNSGFQIFWNNPKTGRRSIATKSCLSPTLLLLPAKSCWKSVKLRRYKLDYLIYLILLNLNRFQVVLALMKARNHQNTVTDWKYNVRWIFWQYFMRYPVLVFFYLSQYIFLPLLCYLCRLYFRFLFGFSAVFYRRLYYVLYWRCDLFYVQCLIII